MARDGSGTFSLPLPDVVAGTDIESTWANTTLTDIETELTDSLSRTGKGGMSAALKLASGTVSAPGLSFTSEANSGLYREAAADIRVALAGAEFARITSAGLRLATTGLVLGTAGQGVSFAANTGTAATDATTTSEILTWYEQGTWKPNLWDDTLSSSEGQSNVGEDGRFTRIGNTVFITGSIAMSSLGTLTTTHQAKIGPLPFTASASGDLPGGVTVISGGALNLSIASMVTGIISISNNYIRLRAHSSTSGPTPLLISEISSGGNFSFYGQYFV